MKFYFSFLIFFIFSLSVFSQIDNKKRSISIPAVESEKDSTDIKKILPSIPEAETKGNTLNVPKISPNLNLPKKEFSMFPQEVFGNPGELFQKSLDKKSQVIKNEMDLGNVGSAVDVFFGDYKTKSKSIKILYRDYGEEDGDLIRISINDEIIEYRVLLINAFKGFKIELRPGLNKIEFLALDEGYLLPNTAHFRIVDDRGMILATDLWALKADVKGVINIVKE